MKTALHSENRAYIKTKHEEPRAEVHTHTLGHPMNTGQDGLSEENFNEISFFIYLNGVYVLFKSLRMSQRPEGLLVACGGVQLPCMVFIRLDKAVQLQTSFRTPAPRVAFKCSHGTPQNFANSRATPARLHLGGGPQFGFRSTWSIKTI